MRGTQSRCRPCMRRTGIIPAYAGNTRPALARRSIARDHPRVCGEHLSFGVGTPPIGGSSPRMRGTPDAGPVDAGERGIIPAYAGNTFDVASSRCAVRDHPRVCGEHMASCRGVVQGMGSSPRMRGTPSLCRRPTRRTGIIPAYAGNTRQEYCAVCCRRDHPRVCGEHAAPSAMVTFFSGSSPRMRGTPCPSCQQRTIPGIIPAYAGNTMSRSKTRC